jgi:CNT family concentrative nucleoside transporter
MERFIGLIGLLVLLGICIAMSNNRRKINPRTLIGGFGLQLLMCIVLLKWQAGNDAMQWLAGKVESFLGLALHGERFLFGNLVDQAYQASFGFQFAFIVLPTIIFFASITSILYYLGVMQKVIEGFAWVMSRIMKTSGAESLSCSAEIFLGQTEAPLLIRPFLSKLTMSELCTIMIGGFGTIAGSVMAGYIQMGIPAQHVIIASCMSAPICLMVAKIIYPEVEQPETGASVKLPKVDAGQNLLDAASRGVTDGLNLALNVGAMLVAFIALVALVDKLMLIGDRWIDGRLLGGVLMENGEYSGYFPGSLKTFFGNLLSPLAYLMGVPKADVKEVGHLLGLKIGVNEFVAYAKLAPEIAAGTISQKGGIMATYMLCGFANFASIGIQIGGTGSLAPDRRSDIAKLGLRAMFGGAIVSCINATVIGLMI